MAIAAAHSPLRYANKAADPLLQAALKDLAPAWLARDFKRFQEVIVAPFEALPEHISSRLTDRVGANDSLGVISRHIQGSVGMIATPKADDHIGLILADSDAAARSNLEPLVGYNFEEIRLVQSDEMLTDGNPALLFVAAALLDKDEAQTFLRLRNEAEGKLISELQQWQKELATISANLQASLTQGLDPLAYGNALQSLQSLKTQTQALRKFLSTAGKRAEAATHRSDPRPQTRQIQKTLNDFSKSGVLSRGVVSKLQNLTQRLTEIFAKTSHSAPAFIVGKLQTRPLIAQPAARAPAMPIPAISTAFTNVAAASVLPFPVTPQAVERLGHVVPSQPFNPGTADTVAPIELIGPAQQPRLETVRPGPPIAISAVEQVTAAVAPPLVVSQDQPAQTVSAAAPAPVNNDLRPPLVKAETSQTTPSDGPLQSGIAGSGRTPSQPPAVIPSEQAVKASDNGSQEARKDTKAPPPPPPSLHPCDKECCNPKLKTVEPTRAPTVEEIKKFEVEYEVKAGPTKPEDMTIREAKGSGAGAGPAIKVVQAAEMNIHAFNKLRPGGRGPTLA